jgi:hypothetical protein
MVDGQELEIEIDEKEENYEAQIKAIDEMSDEV